MRVNGRAWRYEANLSTAQNTARHSRSVGDFLLSVFDHRWLAYVRVFSAISWIWVRTAPAPVSSASMRRLKGLFQSGSARIGGDVKRLNSVSIASVWADPRVPSSAWPSCCGRVSREEGPRRGQGLSYSLGRTS